jgi:serine/threonine protein kinase
MFETASDSYTSTRIIGEGGAARVYQTNDQDGQPWAVKVLDPRKASRDKLKRFRNEYTFCSKHSHPNTVTVVDHGFTLIDGMKSPFFVMPLFNGSLRELMAQGIPTEKVLPLFSQVLNGVEAAHMLNVIHRDLKPENCLYNSRNGVLVVADFGIAHFTTDELYTLLKTPPHTRLANFQYAAPEQRSRGATVDQHADIYSLGLILNELFTGHMPHGTDYKTIATVASDFAYLDDLVAEMLRQDPNGRPQTIEHVKNQLIARGHEFVEKQRLDALKSTVVSTKEITDPLLSDPPRLVHAEWDNTVLTLTLSQPVNEKWVWALRNMGGHSSLWHKGPEHFHISGKTATIAARHSEVQPLVDYFKTWLPRTNQVYADKVRADASQAEQAERERLRKEIAEAEIRASVNKSIRI